VPEHLLPYIETPAVGSPPRWECEPAAFVLDLAATRAQIRLGRKIALSYRDQEGRATERVIWPVIIGYTDATRILVAWCELRQAFRSFRADRMINARLLDERYPERPAALHARWQARMLAEHKQHDLQGGAIP
jgi:predicted DNA-binding transcriptional regulator YafY